MSKSGLIAALAVVVIAVAAPAFASDHTIVIHGDNNGGISTNVTDPGSPGSVSDRTEAVPASHRGGVICTYIFDGSNHSGGWPEEMLTQHVGEAGWWYYRECSNGSFDLVWIPEGTAVPGAPRVTPGQLAAQAANYLPLPAPVVRHNPDHGAGGRPETVVGMETWLWVSPSTFRMLQQTTSAGGVTATVTATPVSTSWRTGSPDAPDIACDGPGVPYDTSRPPESQRTYCSTVYGRSSASRPQTGPDPNDRFFIGSVTTTWRVTWTGTGGVSGTLPPMRRTSTFRLAVAELQAVNDS